MKPKYQFLAILIVTFAVRCATFGDPTLHTDEEFYFLVGQKMLGGALPYVDIWDRKPLGLFAIYEAIAAVSHSVIAYQVAAAISVAITAFIIARIIAHVARWPAQLAAAFLYISMLPWLGGFGGQSPIFYNALMAGAALLLVEAIPDLKNGTIPKKVYFAIALCGFALTVKQTVVVEAVYIGLFSIILSLRGGLPKKTALRHVGAFAAIGILPTALIAGFYSTIGHWPEFWQAMVTSNLNKQKYPLAEILASARFMMGRLLFPLWLAITGLAIAPRSELRVFLAGWLVAAIAALFLVPNFYWHYALPALVPVSCAAAFLFDRWAITIPIVVLFDFVAMSTISTFDFRLHQESRQNALHAAKLIDDNDRNGTLLVYDGPVYLYSLASAKPLSKLVLPWHLKEVVEERATGEDVNEEIRRILSRRPGAVTLVDSGHWSWRDNAIGRRMVGNYVHTHCRKVGEATFFESTVPQRTSIYGNCQ
ncbi:hypothetical protein GRI58_12455 [Porphyrobacter algicida]|uniref:Glycosyltransferase RgtA/B/C/D-like domain-containing protein n=1 Tax=Qipengyuania algicida TaxID=1836209 RepID=A0A845ARW4_9SPHN|nr:hypothetical protein [Qipengyuania algicida]MXP29628.1 hypothetical protein [Qipengyuania algicida]